MFFTARGAKKAGGVDFEAEFRYFLQRLIEKPRIDNYSDKLLGSVF